MGGKDGNRYWDKRESSRGGFQDKLPLIGAVTRKGNVITRVLQHVTKGSAKAFVREIASDKVSLLATDESAVYADLKEYPHGAVNHHARQYVVGAVHTQTIEGFWSIFKRGIVGSFHKVSAKYFPLYAAEFQFRYSNRMNPDIFEAAISNA